MGCGCPMSRDSLPVMENDSFARTYPPWRLIGVRIDRRLSRSIHAICLASEHGSGAVREGVREVSMPRGKLVTADVINQIEPWVDAGLRPNGHCREDRMHLRHSQGEVLPAKYQLATEKSPFAAVDCPSAPRRCPLILIVATQPEAVSRPLRRSNSGNRIASLLRSTMTRLANDRWVQSKAAGGMLR
jgi:hypothetical protein